MGARLFALAASFVWLSALALPAAARPGTEGRQHARAGGIEVAQAAETREPAIIPPTPQLVRRPTRAAASSEHDLPAIVPPVPQPAVRPLRLASLPDPQLPAIVPPVPQLARRPLRRSHQQEAMRACLTRPTRELFDRIEAEFGLMEIISTCRPGARIAGSGRISKHASGEAVDFNAGSRKGEVVRWLIANHRDGGTMTYSDMSHIHVDIGHHFVALGASSGG
jgi:hypothetical protein